MSIPVRKKNELVPGEFKGFVGSFLKGVWHGMGPDFTSKEKPKRPTPAKSRRR